MSISARVESQKWNPIDEGDPAYSSMVDGRVVPTVFPDLRSGKRVDIGAGINFAATGALSGFRLAVEGFVAVYQDLDGPQLETDFIITIGTQYAF